MAWRFAGKKILSGNMSNGQYFYCPQLWEFGEQPPCLNIVFGEFPFYSSRCQLLLTVVHIIDLWFAGLQPLTIHLRHKPAEISSLNLT